MKTALLFLLLFHSVGIVQAAQHLSQLVIEVPPALQGKLALEAVDESVIHDSLNVPGRISTNKNRLAKIGPSISGRVIEVRVSVGQAVTKGQVLAMLDSTQLSDAQASYLKARSQVDFNRLYVERSRSMHQEGIISLLSLRERESLLAEKEIEMNALADKLGVMGMSAVEINVLDQKKHINSRTPVTATISGDVIDRHISVGQIVEISDELFIVADLSDVWIVAEVPEKSASALELNSNADIEIPALSNQLFHGTLSFISSTVDPDSRTVKIRLVLPNSKQKLKPEMLANIHIQQRPIPSLTVSAGAVIRDANQDYVFVEVGENRYALRAVALDDEVDGRRRILSGLERGERVVTQGSFQLNSVRLQMQSH